MKKILLLIFVFFISLDVFAQILVKKGSFKKLQGVIENKVEYVDGNDLPMALIKITTENMPEQERMRLLFSGNRATQIIKEPKREQMWIYISADAATFIDIKHPDYGTYKYSLPEKLCDYCIYEMVLQYIPIELEQDSKLSSFVKIESEPVSDIYIDGKNYGQTPKVIKDLSEGEHKLKLSKTGYYDLEQTIVVKKGEIIKLSENLKTTKKITVSTFQNGDKVYFDGKCVGVSPMIISNVEYGVHEIKAVRGNLTTSKSVEIKANGVNDEFKLAFGEIMTIKSDQAGNNVYIDGEKVGVTPIVLDLSLGQHKVEVKKGRRSQVKTIYAAKQGGSQTTYFTLVKESPEEYFKNGYDFVTFNVAYSLGPQLSCGLTYGSVKDCGGWFVSVMSDFDFKGFLASEDSDGEVILTGESRSSRLSLMGGYIMGCGPVSIRYGAGYGIRVKSWEAKDGNWYKYADDSYSSMEFSLGLQTNLVGWEVSVDFIAVGLSALEVKLGFGINKKK